MGQCCSSGEARVTQRRRRRRSRRGSLGLMKQNQVYHLNHVECLPYQGRRSRYSTQSSSFMGLVTRQNSSYGRSVPSTRQSSLAGSNLALRRPESVAGGSNLVLRHGDPVLASSNPSLLQQHRDSAGGSMADGLAHQQSLRDLARGSMSYTDYHRHSRSSNSSGGRGGRMFRSYLDYQAVRQSYLLAVSHDSLPESTQGGEEGGEEGGRESQGGQLLLQPPQEMQYWQTQSTHSLSMEVFLALPLHLSAFLFCPSQAVQAVKRTLISFTPPSLQYSGTPLNRTPLGQLKVFQIVRCPHFRGY